MITPSASKKRISTNVSNRMGTLQGHTMYNLLEKMPIIKANTPKHEFETLPVSLIWSDLQKNSSMIFNLITPTNILENRK
jgi:hypothetical protein